jgi:hypothetical protein
LRDLQVLAQRRKDRKEQACRKLTEWIGHALVLAAFERELRFRRHVRVEPGDAGRWTPDMRVGVRSGRFNSVFALFQPSWSKNRQVSAIGASTCSRT